MYRGLRADLEPPELKDRPGRSIHLFLGSSNWTSLSGHLNPDGTYAGTLAMKNGGQHQQLLKCFIMTTYYSGSMCSLIPAMCCSNLVLVTANIQQ